MKIHLTRQQQQKNTKEDEQTQFFSTIINTQNITKP